MIDTREWKEQRVSIMRTTDMMSMQSKRDMVFMGRMSKRQRCLRQAMIGLVTVGVLVTGLLGFSDAANGARAATQAAAPAGAVSGANLGMSFYSDYLFVLAVPFAVALLGHACVTLSRIQQKLR